MKIVVLILFFLIALNPARAQFIRVNGEVETQNQIPIQGVVVMAFDKGVMIKNYVTDEKGEYSFRVDRMKFDVLFYKPGMLTHSYGVSNKLDRNVQGIYIGIKMDDSLAQTVISTDAWLQRHHISRAYLDSIYNYEISKAPPISARQARKNQKEIMKAALAEQKRFANYKETTVDKSGNSDEVTTIRIGPDKYRMVTDVQGGEKYFKNIKPVTEATYKFETTRRYEGVLKDEKNVKQFEKYKPMEHVKTQDK